MGRSEKIRSQGSACTLQNFLMSTHNNFRKEEFSYAYIHAISAAAGYACTPAPRLLDLDGIDLTISAPGILGSRQRPRIDMQVKCTSTSILHKDCIKFPLEIEAYENLRYDNPTIPQFLVVVLVPTDVDDWLKNTEDELSIKRCGYWKSLKGALPTTNTDKITITIPRGNLLTIAALEKIMSHTGEGEVL